MNTELLFLLGCMSARLFLAYLAKIANRKWLKIMGYLALLPAIGFMYFYLSGIRKIGTFGEKIWWNSLRPIHASLYGLFAYFAIRGNLNAWIFLLVDAIIGLTGFLREHYPRM
jgi:hypothetical protein